MHDQRRPRLQFGLRTALFLVAATGPLSLWFGPPLVQLVERLVWFGTTHRIQPSLVVRNPIIEVGDTWAGPGSTVSFRIVNSGRLPIHIKPLKPD